MIRFRVKDDGVSLGMEKSEKQEEEERKGAKERKATHGN